MSRVLELLVSAVLGCAGLLLPRSCDVFGDVAMEWDDELQGIGGGSGLDWDAPFDGISVRDVRGFDRSPGGKYSTRGSGGTRYQRAWAYSTEQAAKDGLEWLKLHQDEDGRWDCDGFVKHDPLDDPCSAPGWPQHDVGVSGLALLAFLGDDSTTRRGPYRDVVARGIWWLRGQQDLGSGLFGEPVGSACVYDHAIATIAVCETYTMDKMPLLHSTARRAVGFIERARNPYGVWSYDVPPVGRNDTSVTGWMVFALCAAEDCGLSIDCEAYDAARNWFDAMTDVGSGRCGYDTVESPSSRIEGVNDDWSTGTGEAMTAVALLARIFMGDDPKDVPVMKRHAELLRESLPEYRPHARTNDMYYWYYGTYAMYQMGEPYWKAWNRAMKPAVLDAQRNAGEGAHFGSWDPVGPWGEIGGRVYSTALMTLCLEVYYRYSRVLGDE